mgnify:CR=1 FL=1
MASSVNFAQNSYAGEVLEDLLTYTAQGNDTYKEGLIHIKSGIQFEYTIPAVKLGKIIQDNKPTPTSAEGAGAGTVDGLNQYTFTERKLTPQEFMVYLEFNPRDFEKYYKFAQPDGNLVFRELDPKIQATMLRLLMDRKNEWVGEAIWNSSKGGTATAGITAPTGATAIGGDCAGGPMKYFDGTMKRLLENTTTDPKTAQKDEAVILAGDTELTTGEEVEAALQAMYRKCPKQIRKSAGLVFVCGVDVWDMYDKYLSDKTVKYADNTKINQYRYKGIRIVPIINVPEHTIVLGHFTTGMDSNLWMGVDYANDTEVVKVDRLQSNSELYFFLMRMKMDVNIVRPAEIVLWTAYKKA